MNFRTECPQMGLLWTEEALAPFLRTVSDPSFKKRFCKPTKLEIGAINLDLPLAYGTVFDARYAYMQAEQAPMDTDAPVIELVRPIDDLAAVPEERFGLLKLPDIAKLAAGLLYNDLHLLINERGSEKTKAEILDWLFADEWNYRRYANGYHRKPLEMIPFTPHFCCAVEEISLDDLRAAVSGLVEFAVQRDREESSLDQEINPSLFEQPQMDLERRIGLH